ncbi:MAG: hypothetical protein K0S29_639 [Gammaproteobacteria bacterium]|jgi:ankyrin repeat protein|nr:hypothetical protein [Gammaproteobacteria bacterium]
MQGYNLYEVVLAGDLEGVKGLLRTGADPDVRYDEYKNETALHAAVRAKAHELEIARVLLKANADMRKKNTENNTAPELAALYGLTDLMKLFIEHGLDPQDLYPKILAYHRAEVMPCAQHSIGSEDSIDAARQLIREELEAWLATKSAQAAGQVSSAASQSGTQASISSSLAAVLQEASPAPADVLSSASTSADLHSQPAPSFVNPYLTGIIIPAASASAAPAHDGLSPVQIIRRPVAVAALARQASANSLPAAQAVSASLASTAIVDIHVFSQAEHSARLTGKKSKRGERDDAEAAAHEATVIRESQQKEAKIARHDNPETKP